MARNYPTELTPFIAELKKLPGVGTRTAERFAFELLNWPKEELVFLGEIILGIKDKIPPCTVCGCLTNQGRCSFCDQTTRNASQLCIIATARDAFAIEETKTYQGLYHVVEHLLSPLDGRHASQLNIERIQNRIQKNEVREIILAFDSTLEGDTTALYIKSQLGTHLSMSRLAFGLPMGSSLEYIDGSTLTRALKGRQSF
ncbi:MAG TPA: recombination mediator RecR [Chlamydiales bacterium]|nr:recombination mediator RecR [Chlamydiales bacterium]